MVGVMAEITIQRHVAGTWEIVVLNPVKRQSGSNCTPVGRMEDTIVKIRLSHRRCQRSAMFPMLHHWVMDIVMEMLTIMHFANGTLAIVAQKLVLTNNGSSPRNVGQMAILAWIPTYPNDLPFPLTV